MDQFAKRFRLDGKVALVTGASRGIGKGVAKVLINQGATVYITGRKHSGKSEFMNVEETAEELNNMKLSGKCFGLYCDHSKDEETKSVFDFIEQKHHCLDILVNNAFSGLDLKQDFSSPDYWKQGFDVLWDKTINVGLRSNFIASCYATKMMVEKGSGLIVNISSFGGLGNLFNPVYGVGKEGNDRLSVEMGAGLKKHNIAVISLWPGLVKTEVMEKICASKSSQVLGKYWHMAEDVTLTGKAIAALAADPNIMRMSSRVHLVADLAHKYGFTDVDGKYPTSVFSMKFLVSLYSPSISKYIPHFIQAPAIFLSYYYSKF